MPRSRRCCKAGWWTGQHYGSSACSKARLIRRIALALVILIAAQPSPAQSLLHIRVLEGEGAIHAASSRSSRGLVVEITDETGRPVDGAAVSFRMPVEGPGATFGRDMRTEIKVTTPDGRAAVYEFQTGSQTGPFQIRVTAVKGQIRAGTVVSQYVSDAPVKSKRLVSARSGSSRKWLIIGAVVAGAAAAVLAGRGSGGSSPAPQTPAPPATPPQIGAPSISIGGPQ